MSYCFKTNERFSKIGYDLEFNWNSLSHSRTVEIPCLHLCTFNEKKQQSWLCLWTEHINWAITKINSVDDTDIIIVAAYPPPVGVEYNVVKPLHEVISKYGFPVTADDYCDRCSYVSYTFLFSGCLLKQIQGEAIYVV